MRSHPTRLSRLLLGDDPKQRLPISQTLLSFGVYLLFAGVQLAAVSLGLLQMESDLPLLLFTLLTSSGFYLLVRSGWSARLSSDASLAMPQMLVAVFSVAWAYAITGATGGSVISIMTVVLMFGMFSLEARQTTVAAAVALLALGVVVSYRAAWRVPGFDWRVEAMQLLLCVIVMAAMATLSLRWQEMRQRLRQQKADLAAALARIEALATRDALTGLLNRRAMLEALQREARVAERREHGPLCLVVLDLDHFKRINDSHGHRLGDAVLQAFAELASGELRGGDVLARWGGEEFLLLLPGTEPEEAGACLARIRLRVAAWRPEGDATAFGVSFSAGLVCCSGPDDIDAAIDRADAAMYRAKGAGRDRVEFAVPAVAATGPAPVAPAADDTPAIDASWAARHGAPAGGAAHAAGTSQAAPTPLACMAALPHAVAASPLAGRSGCAAVVRRRAA